MKTLTTFLTKGPRLADLSGGRDNNLNLIRAIAATAVLVSHAYPIALGPGAEQPLHALTGFTLGELSVFVFFAISGFLIAGSFERSSSHASFLVARAVRLFPALFISLLLVMFLIGPAVTSLSTSAYLTHTETWVFLVKNMALVTPQFTLPGVFEGNPYKDIEGSIWTLFHEVACYMALFFAGLFGILRRACLMTASIAALIMIWIVKTAVGYTIPITKIELFFGLAIPFAFGMLIYRWQHRLVLSVPLMVLLWALAFLGHDTVLAGVTLMTAMIYSVFWLGYVPGGHLRSFNRLGDYSYGTYIYAFPIQGLVVWYFGAMTPLENMMWSLPLTLLPSILSWHLIEQPALNNRHRLLAWQRSKKAMAAE